jgi:hypothetical protein
MGTFIVHVIHLCKACQNMAVATQWSLCFITEAININTPRINSQILLCLCSITKALLLLHVSITAVLSAMPYHFVSHVCKACQKCLLQHNEQLCFHKWNIQQKYRRTICCSSDSSYTCGQRSTTCHSYALIIVGGGSLRWCKSWW